MRKIYSIFLLGCFCLYYFGYIVYFFAFQQKLDKQWEENIWEDSLDLSHTELIEIPLVLPYMANQEDFQTTNLSMEIEGQYLRVVKQRYQNDTLQIIYIKDYEQQKLETQVTDWIKSITYPSSTNKTARNHLFGKFFLKDFMRNEIYTFQTWDGIFKSIVNPTHQNHYSTIFLSLKTPPPQVG